ncbi:hypothetical protein [Orenia marismortui]|uniref:PDZ domain-containing protein n=1 Tax=Orenia marismortui TaxID=46469 RepID=A0A4R8H880_9FIRM|nr:hypothetical protein [Orenia marismortui]TDX50959.1 hypothetical protein C7959_11737 [Orenia marismortui]
MDETIAYLDRYGAETIRVFLPGYTKYSPESIKFNLNLWNDLRVFIDKCRTKYEAPIALEPSRIVNLDAIISGIIKELPAAKSKLKISDKIIKVNDKELFSRVDAFNEILKAANPKLSFERTGRVEEIIIEKDRGERSGLVFDYDLSLDLVADIDRIIKSCRAKRTLLLSSQLASKRIGLGIEYLKSHNQNLVIDLLKVKSYFVGGSIMSDGLLVVDDFRKMLYQYQEELLDIDLVGERYSKLEDKFDIKVEIVG